MDIEIENCEKLIKIHTDCSEVEKISSDKLSYSRFFTEYMYKNIPVIIKNVKLLTPLSEKWFSENSFNIDLFSADIKENIDVPVYNCSIKYFNSHEKANMSLCDYADYWKSENKSELLYLKDFHLKQLIPDLNFYNVPKFFASDWLNEYLIDKNKDDYRFVYIGVQDTWTPFHSDVFNSYSWSGNVCGLKQWLILHPKEELKLMDSLGTLPFSINKTLLEEKNVKYFDIIQEPNDVIFIPSKWYHQVHNLTNVVSINHNWFNSCNIQTIKESLFKNLEDVKTEIKDCADMENFDEHCQLMLKSLCGMDSQDFVDILLHIDTKRRKTEKIKLFDNFEVGSNLIKYELDVINSIFLDIINNGEVQEDLKLKIQEYLKENS